MKAKGNHKKHQLETSKHVVWYVLLALFIIGGGYLVYQPQKNEAATTSITTTPSEPQQDFSYFVSGWNDKVRAFNLPDSLLLASTDNKTMLRQLKKYINNYALDNLDNRNNEWTKMAEKYPSSIFKFYQEFRLVHVGKKRINTNDWLNLNHSNDLFHLLQKTTANQDNDESIKLVLASNDPCVFFALYKYELWKRGLSKNMDSCNLNIMMNQK